MEYRREPIAIVGMGCRFPGAADVDALWELLLAGGDATGPTPTDRYDAEAMYSPEPELGKVIAKRSGYLADAFDFDAPFFGMTRAQASHLDPQQRLLLMAAYEAFADAGLTREAVGGTRTGVYVGNMNLDFWDVIARRGPEAITPSVVYNLRSVLSGRLAYEFDLRGPSITVDTACSSSLSALHLACLSLRAGETEAAVVAGVNLKLNAEEDLLLSQARMLARDGRCKFGDARADGFAPSDGAAVVVLKPLSKALADGDPVRALVLGGNMSNDGRASGSLLAPSAETHAQMLRWAYEDAGVDAADVDFIEAHGTGTPLIDPIEFAALGEVLGKGRPADRPALVGSVKSNIGHTEGAAGVAAVIKSTLALQHRRLPASLHYETPNPKIAWDALPLEVPTGGVDLDGRGRPLIAGVSGQGISAANAHIVLAEAPRREAAPDDGRAYPFVLSGATEQALRDNARNVAEWLAGKGAGHALRDLCYSAAVRTTHHAHRAAVAAESHAGLAAALAAVAAGEAPEAEGPGADFREGRPVDWTEVFDDTAAFVRLPHYPWQLETFPIPEESR
ncbi:polyketide synthase [Glycomyces sp. A-F 0318]|uniref:beta-ketoacyl synthase N-terminal-like domain-containing protein n=1 Tax=Glycomyces amatae TaxID=2881355 RepID=UPI001E361367|nr:polyketide synthase [Glycomyces amatae]MCD0444095.1 polyketide synthase [Glycomyces amatae]